jgi:hypothetical protein
MVLENRWEQVEWMMSCNRTCWWRLEHRMFVAKFGSMHERFWLGKSQLQAGGTYLAFCSFCLVVLNNGSVARYCFLLWYICYIFYYIFLLIGVILVQHPMSHWHVRLSHESRAMAEDPSQIFLTFIIYNDRSSEASLDYSVWYLQNISEISDPIKINNIARF